jgi:hypothetical protein
VAAAAQASTAVAGRACGEAEEAARRPPRAGGRRGGEGAQLSIADANGVPTAEHPEEEGRGWKRASQAAQAVGVTAAAQAGNAAAGSGACARCRAVTWRNLRRVAGPRSPLPPASQPLPEGSVRSSPIVSCRTTTIPVRTPASTTRMPEFFGFRLRLQPRCMCATYRRRHSDNC